MLVVVLVVLKISVSLLHLVVSPTAAHRERSEPKGWSRAQNVQNSVQMHSSEHTEMELLTGMSEHAMGMDMDVDMVMQMVILMDMDTDIDMGTDMDMETMMVTVME